MEQLLQITTIPIKYELKITDAEIQRHSGNVQLQIKRDKGGLHIESEPVKIQIDTSRARSSIVPTTRQSIEQAAQKGEQTAGETAARFAKEGKMLLWAKKGEGSEVFKQIIQGRMALPTGEFQLGFIPTAGADLTATDPQFTIEYQMDKLNFDWRMNRGDFEFIPGKVELEILQHPDVKIEYIGKPMYVPPSYDEKMTGENIDVKA